MHCSRSLSVNILCEVIDKTFDFSNIELCIHDRYLYQNASKNPICFGQVICQGYRVLRIQLNVKHIVALENESAYFPFSKMLSYAGFRIHSSHPAVKEIQK